MTDDETTEGPETSAEGAESQREPSGDGNPDEQADAAQSQREARYRRRLRDTEAERDALSEQLTALQRQVVSNIVEAERVKPETFWALRGESLDDLLDDTGAVDPRRVVEIVDDLAKTHGLRQPSGLRVPSEGNTPRPPARDSWADAFAPKGA